MGIGVFQVNMHIEKFKSSIIKLLHSRKIEKNKINNSSSLLQIFLNNKFVYQIYKDFNKNYDNLYGNDLSLYYCKIYDFIYRLDLLVTECFNYNVDNLNEISNIILKFSNNPNVSLFDSVDFNENDLEIIQEFDSELNELLLNKRI